MKAEDPQGTRGSPAGGPDRRAVLRAVAEGAPVLDVLADLVDVVVDAVPGSAATLAHVGIDGSVQRRSRGIGPAWAAVLDRTGVTRPRALVVGDVDRLGELQRSPGWTSVVVATTEGAHRGCWAIDRVVEPGALAGRIVVLVPEDRPPTEDEAATLHEVADLFTIAVSQATLRARLEHQALHDELTGLPNRRAFVRRVSDAQADRDAEGVGVLVCALDGVGLVHEGFGQAAGDLLVQEVAHRVRRLVRTDDLVARVGPAELAVLCPGAAEPEDLDGLAARLAHVVDDPVAVPEPVAVTIAVGTTHAAAADPVRPLLEEGELALAVARRSEAGPVRYEPGMRAGAVARLDLERSLRQALQDGELRLYFQPVVALADGHLRGCEALIRWPRPGRGVVGADDLIPVATETGLIGALGRWAIETAVAEAATWPGALTVSVNLSARQLGDDDLVETVRTALAAHGVAPGRLCLEITESDLVADPTRAAEVLAGLSALGVRLAIDDFGTGYATLDYLRRFAGADVLKLDGSFVTGLADPKARDLAIVSAALVLARNLGFETVAEGIETPAQAEMLRRLGCDLGQGHLFCPALPPHELAVYLAQEAARGTLGPAPAGT